tara:strand:- start:2195 stop:2824 length:630 start_codon:yes stop_codon:yes gene_type:complete
MASKKKIQEQNFKNLLEVSSLIKDMQYFIFYGTLLGIVRDNNVIKGDDDVDFMLCFKSKKLLLKKMSLIKNFKLNKKVSNNYFAQYVKIKKGIKTFVDFYFYLNDPKKNYIIDRHNWLGNINDKRFALHFQKKMIFPINKKGKFNIPKNSKNICRYLYGETWSIPLKKNINYRAEIINNTPLLIRRSYLGSITRRVKEILNINNYKKIV